MDLAFREACGKKVQKACKKHHLLKNKNSEKLQLLGHFGILPKEKTSLFSVDFRKPFRKISNIFHIFFYLKAQQLFSMVKFEFFLTLEAVVRAEKQNHKNENCLIPRVGWRQMRGFHHFFSFLEKKGVRNDQNFRNCSNYSFFIW